MPSGQVVPQAALLTVAPEAKLVPVIATGTVAPGAALAGLIEEIAGAGVPIVKVAGEVTPPGVVSTTFAVAGLALAETLNVALI